SGEFDQLREEFGAEGETASRRGSFTDVATSASSSQSITRRRLLQAKSDDIPSPLISPYAEEAALEKRGEWAEFLGIPGEMVNSVGTRMMLVPTGEFLMGSPQMEEGHVADEKQHPVRITRPYFLGTHPVTVGEF